MSRLAALLALVLAACGAERGEPSVTNVPMRIVSLDACADQYVLRFADREQILAVSPGAVGDYSFERAGAAGIPTIRPSAEDVLLASPDLVVRSYGGGPGLDAFLRRSGIPVVHVGWPQTLEEVIANTERLAAELGHPEDGAAFAAGLRERLADLPQAEREDALYLTPSGVTSGPGSLVDEVMAKAGYRNVETRPGWHDIPLERLAYDQPGHVVTGFFDSADRFESRWSPLRHPLAREAVENAEHTDVPGAMLACSAWPLVDAAERLAETR